MVDHTQSTCGCMRRNVDTGEYAASSLVRKYHDHYYTTKDRSLSVNNTENEKYNDFFYLTDCSPYEDRSSRSLTSLLSGLICYKRDNRTICSPRDVTYYTATSGYICHLDLGYQL